MARIKWELDILRPDYFSDRDYAQLSEKHQDFITFEVCSEREHLRSSLADLQVHKQYLWLAIRIAAAKLGPKEATIQTSWRRYHKYLDVS